MASIISAGTTSGTALNMAGDTSGVLQLATNGSTTAITIDASQKVLVNTTTARANFFNSTSSPIVQVEGTSFNTSSLSASRNSNDTSSPFLVLAKSRGTAVGSNTIVQNGDSPGQISFQGNDGTEFVEAARITCNIDGTPGANDMPGRLEFYTTADGASTPTERMRIDSSGNLLFNSGYGSVATAYGCRAWVNFNGTGTVAIRASGNVSSITDRGTGTYTVNMSTALPDANYSVVITGQATSTTDNGVAYISNETVDNTLTTTSFPIRTGIENAFGTVDLPIICCSVFR